MMMIPTESSSRLNASPSTPVLVNSTSSLDITLERPYTCAIPSPTSTTRPTLVTVISCSKPAICCFRMSPISVARTTILVLSSHGPSGRMALAMSTVVESLMARCLRGRKTRAQPAQLVHHAAVDELVADEGDDSADNRGVHLRAKPNLFTNDAGQLLPH